MRELAAKRAPGIELVWFLLCYVVVCTFLVLLVQSSSFETNPSVMSWAVLADLAITAPLLYAFFIRNTSMPRLSIVTLAIAGVFLASFIIPPNHREPVLVIRNWLIPVLELCALGFVVVSAKRAVRTFGNSKGFDRQEAIAAAVRRLCGQGRLGKLLTAELTMLYYFLRFPVNRNRRMELMEAPSDAEVFTYDQTSGIRALLVAFLMIVAVELVAVHVLLEMWSVWLAWLASLSTLYMGVVIIAQVRAIPFRPIFVHRGHLRITNGMFRIADVPIEQIERIEPLTANGESEVDGLECLSLNCSVPSSPNVAIHLTESVEAELLYGKTQAMTLAYLYVDDRDRFVRHLRKICKR